MQRRKFPRYFCICCSCDFINTNYVIERMVMSDYNIKSYTDEILIIVMGQVPWNISDMMNSLSVQFGSMRLPEFSCDLDNVFYDI